MTPSFSSDLAKIRAAMQQSVIGIGVADRRYSPPTPLDRRSRGQRARVDADFAKHGVEIAVVNDFCPVPKGIVALPLECARDLLLVEHAGLCNQAAETMHRLILETLSS